MFVEVVDQLLRIQKGLEYGVQAVVNTLPLLIQQQFDSEVMKALDSTADEYLNALDVNWDNNILVVELNKDAFLPNALETGCSAWNMKDRLNTSSKAKTSAKGWKFMSIPIPQTKTGRVAKTDKGRDLQEKIRAALDRPQYGLPKIKRGADGSISVSEALITDDPAVKGLYRTRRYKDWASLENKQTPNSTQFILFRTMSNNPEAKGQWQHPGFAAKNIFKKVEAWSSAVLPEIISRIIDGSVKKALEEI